MKAIAMIVCVGVLNSFLGLGDAAAAVTCIENRSTGKFEEKAAGRGRMTGECDAQSAMNMVSSVAEVEAVSAAGGTKIIDGVIVTNAPKMAMLLADVSKPSRSTLPPNAPLSERIMREPAPVHVAKPVVVAAPVIVAAAAPVQPVVVAPVAAPAAVVKVEQSWEVRAEDGTIYGVLKRWSKTAGMQLMWETEKHDFRAGATATYRGSFDVAVYKLMESLEHSDYPVRACIYEDNGAVRIIHAKKSCKG